MPVGRPQEVPKNTQEYSEGAPKASRKCPKTSGPPNLLNLQVAAAGAAKCKQFMSGSEADEHGCVSWRPTNVVCVWGGVL